jgi:hypothetical protein
MIWRQRLVKFLFRAMKNSSRRFLNGCIFLEFLRNHLGKFNSIAYYFIKFTIRLLIKIQHLFSFRIVQLAAQ